MLGVQAAGMKGRWKVGGRKNDVVGLFMDDGRGRWWRDETSG